MKIRPLVSSTSVASAALAASVLFAPQAAWSERTPPRALPLPEAVSARVIVKFKADGVTMRARALSASANALTVQQVMAERATLLGARHGLALAAGAAVGERVQVVSAQGLDARALAARLAADPDVEYAEPVQRMRRTAAPNDPLYAASVAINPVVGQWYLRAPSAAATSAINAEAAWDLMTQGSPSVIVAVLDTGARFDHPDLTAKLVPGYDFISDTEISNDGDGRDADAADPGDFVSQADLANPTFAGCDADSSSWHGTQTAGLVGASTNNVIGMAGTGAAYVRVMPVRVLGKCYGDSSDIQAAIRWAAGVAVPGVPANPTPAKVINLSLGSDNSCSAGYLDAVNQARARGAVVVAAAGNSTGHAVGQPANCAGVIGVAALRHAGSKVGFSDIGPQISIAAPGGNCVNLAGDCLYPLLTTVSTNPTNAVPNTDLTYTDGTTIITYGTSFASPLVAATVGLMFSANPALTPDEVATRLKASARPFPASGLPPDPETGPVQTCQAPSGAAQFQCYCTTSTCGAGMLNAAGAVASAQGVPVVAVAGTPSAPLPGQTMTLSGAGSAAPAGRSIVSQQWTLVNGGGIVTGFIGATNLLSSSVTPSAAGSFTVRLTVTDNLGAVAASELTVTVAAAASGGGGAFAWPWLALLAGFVGALARRQRAAMR